MTEENPDLVERMDASGGEYYIIEIVDDYYATVTRGSDRKKWTIPRNLLDAFIRDLGNVEENR